MSLTIETPEGLKIVETVDGLVISDTTPGERRNIHIVGAANHIGVVLQSLPEGE